MIVFYAIAFFHFSPERVIGKAVKKRKKAEVANKEEWKELTVRRVSIWDEQGEHAV